MSTNLFSKLSSFENAPLRDAVFLPEILQDAFPKLTEFRKSIT